MAEKAGGVVSLVVGEEMKVPGLWEVDGRNVTSVLLVHGQVPQ